MKHLKNYISLVVLTVYSILGNSQNLEDAQDFIIERVIANPLQSNYSNSIFFRKNILKTDAEKIASKNYNLEDFENIFIYSYDFYSNSSRTNNLFTVAQIIDIRDIYKVSVTSASDQGVKYFIITAYINNNFYAKEYENLKVKEPTWKYLDKMEIRISDNVEVAQQIKRAIIQLGMLKGIVIKDGDLFIDIPTKTSTLGYLYEFDGKYPMEVHLFEENPLKKRLEKLLGSNFQLFKDNFKLQTQISIDKQNFCATGCRPHFCGSDASAIGINIEDDAIFVGILTSEKLMKYYENEDKIAPKIFDEWIIDCELIEIAKNYIYTGTINRLEEQGNSFLLIEILTSDNKKVPIMCSSGTTVYENNLEIYWTSLKIGNKIGIIGEWSDGWGPLKVGADRIDVLSKISLY